MKKDKSFVFFLIFLVVFSSITTLYKKVMEPVLVQFSQSNAYTLAMTSTEKAIRQNLEDFEYSDIISESKDENGKLTTLCANTAKINKISNELAISIEENIAAIDESYIKIPLSLLFNAGIFGGIGIKVKIKTIPLGDTKIECISQFDNIGINQTRHRIILKVKTYYTIIAPVYLKNECYEKDIVIAETILNGDIPSTYYSLDLKDDSDMLDLTQ